MVIIRIIQGLFIDEVSYYQLKWSLLGEWLNQGYRMYSETFDYTGPLAVLVYKYFDLLFGRSMFLHYGLSSIVIIYQAGIFNMLLLKNKAYDENSYLPAFLYMILMVSIPDFMALSPQLLSLTFILLALQNVLRRIDNQVTDELFLNSGIFIGIASMIYLPSVVFFLVFLVSLILFSTAVTRRLALYLFSFFLVFGLCSLYFYLRGDFQIFIDSYLIQNLIMQTGGTIGFYESLIICAGFVIIFFLSVFKTWSSARQTNFQQKIQQVIWLMFLGGISTFLLSNEKSLHELVFMVPVIAYFWTYYFILLKKRIFKLIMPGLLIFGILGYSVFTYKGLLGNFIPNKPENAIANTMILGENISYYKEVEIATPCFNSLLSRKSFEGLDYYNSASRLYLIFENSDPNLIIDEIGVMPETLNRFPNIKARYRDRGNGEYVKISN
ncbi:hypothetical protein [Ekhidna sp.]|uniref:hypothetical protein n=1 Tax=Ekhidna sp. TaxID=2608089 RepID=UPI003B510F0E